MTRAVLLKAQANTRAKFNQAINEKDILIEDYHEFTRVLEEINAQRLKKRACQSR